MNLYQLKMKLIAEYSLAQRMINEFEYKAEITTRQKEIKFYKHRIKTLTVRQKLIKSLLLTY